MLLPLSQVIILPNIKAWGTSYSHLRFKKHNFCIYSTCVCMQAEPRACLYKSDQESGRICHAEALSESQNIKIKIQGGGKGNPTYRPAKTNPKHTGLEEEALYIKTATAQIEAVHNNLNRDQCWSVLEWQWPLMASLGLSGVKTYIPSKICLKLHIVRERCVWIWSTVVLNLKAVMR